MAKIIGNTTATPNPRPDWLQTDETKADYIKNKPNIIGQITTEGGEIFNDYENNQSISEFSSAKGSYTFAGTKFFYIIDKNETNKTYVLKDYYLDITNNGEFAVGDLFSITSGGNREDCGTITSIIQEEGTNNAIVTASNWYWDNSTGLTEPTYDNPSTSFIFRVMDKPMCGTDIMGTGASSEGYSTKALMVGCHSEGYSTIAGGKYSHAEGRNTRSGYASHAEGWGTKAMGQEAHSEGYFTDAQGWYSHSEGNNTKSIGQSSHAEGANSVASGQFSHAEGNNNIASGQGAHAEGLNTQATEEATHSEGNTTKAIGINAHAEGNQTEASGDASHSEGYNTKATGGMSHSEGYSTTASNSYAHAEGRDTTASGNASHAEGANTKASGSQAHAEGSNTLASNFNTHAEGNNTQATKNEAHAEGRNTTASGGASHAEGEDTTASGYSSHAEGGSTVAGGYSSHAEGRNTKASGSKAHAEGENTTASGYSSHAEGGNTVADGEYSHAGGLGTIASGSSQTSIGKYNREDVNALLIIGNGTGPSATERSNAFTVNRNGTATIQTNPIEDMDVATKKYVDNEIATFDFIKVVDALPTTGLSNKIYLVPNGSTENQDLFDEYVWVDGKFEFLGTKQFEIDLTSYYTKEEVDNKLEIVDNQMEGLNKILVFNSKEELDNELVITTKTTIDIDAAYYNGFRFDDLALSNLNGEYHINIEPSKGEVYSVIINNKQIDYPSVNQVSFNSDSYNSIYIEIANNEPEPVTSVVTVTLTKTSLTTGTLLLIKDSNSPDYWWDGQTIQPIEAANPDLSNYYTKEEIDTAIGDIEAAFDELHTYAQALVNGGNA